MVRQDGEAERKEKKEKEEKERKERKEKEDQEEKERKERKEKREKEDREKREKKERKEKERQEEKEKERKRQEEKEQRRKRRDEEREEEVQQWMETSGLSTSRLASRLGKIQTEEDESIALTPKAIGDDDAEMDDIEAGLREEALSSTLSTFRRSFERCRVDWDGYWTGLWQFRRHAWSS